MGCALSSSKTRRSVGNGNGNGNDGVVVCRERKRLVKKAVKQRQAFAEAHSSFIHSLSSVSSAIALFVSGHSSSSEFLIDCPSQVAVCDHFYDDAPQPQAESQQEQEGQAEMKWDFFNLADNNKPKPKAVGNQVNKEDSKDHVINYEKGKFGRDLLEALKLVEDHFLNAYQCGLHLSRMLQVNHNNLHPAPAFHSHQLQLQLEDNSSRKRSTSSRSSSFKSLLSSSSVGTSSTSTDCRGDRKTLLSSTSNNSSTRVEGPSSIIDGSSGMVSGSHSCTLDRLYAWEQKLYREVKAGYQTQKSYKLKCSQLRKKDLEGSDELLPSKATSEVTDLYHCILVAFQRAESISKQIEKLRDEELQPQIVELLHGLMRTWEAISECHEVQKKIMGEIKSFNRSDDGQFCNDSHRLATHQLEAVVQNWQCCFSEYICSQKAYVRCLYGWLSKYVNPESVHYYKGGSQPLPLIFDGPTLMITFQSWLTKEIDRKTVAIKKAEDKALIQKQMAHSNVKDQVESRMMINGLQMGFSSVFESLADFSRASSKVYAHLVSISQNTKV